MREYIKPSILTFIVYALSVVLLAISMDMVEPYPVWVCVLIGTIGLITLFISFLMGFTVWRNMQDKHREFFSEE